MESDADALHVACEGIPERVFCDLADETRTPTEAGETVGRVGSRTTTRLGGIVDSREQMCRALRVDEGHRSLDDLFIHEEPILDCGDDVDECVADRYDVIGKARVAREVDWRHVGKP